MVQASEDIVEHPDLPQALMLLGEMNVSAQHVATLVDNMIQRVRNGELSTHQGLSFLEMKYHMLLSYLINLTYVVLRKCSGERIEGDPSIDRLIEIRTVLEKVRPIDHKLKYQIDKLVKSAITGPDANDPTTFRANPGNLLSKLDDESEGEEGGDSEVETTRNSKSGVYVPPKLSAVHFVDDTVQERTKKAQDRNKKFALSSSIMQDLRDEYLDTPVEVTQGSRAQHKVTKKQVDRERYEEEYMTRLPMTKSEKHSHRQLSTVGTLGDEVTDFGGPSGKRKRPMKSKGKKKSYKRRRLH